MTVKNQLNYHKGDKEIYTLLHGRSDLLLNYSEFLAKNPQEDNFERFDDISSIYIYRKYDSPVTTWAHTQGDDKITVLYNAFEHPIFFAEKYFPPFQEMEILDPLLKINHEPYKRSFPDNRQSITFLHEIKEGGPLPQIFIISDMGYFRSIGEVTRIKLLEISDGCYEYVSRYIYHMIELHEYEYRTIYRILPHKRCRDRMIKKGYYRNNKSLGKAADFERAFHGFNSPYKEIVDEIKRNNTELFK